MTSLVPRLVKTFVEERGFTQGGVDAEQVASERFGGTRSQRQVDSYRSDLP